MIYKIIFINLLKNYSKKNDFIYVKKAIKMNFNREGKFFPLILTVLHVFKRFLIIL